jgi:hypothetical protein
LDFWGNGNRLESLANRGFEQVSYPKKYRPQFPQIELTSFLGTAFGELEQSVPTGEDYNHEEEELQGPM